MHVRSESRPEHVRGVRGYDPRCPQNLLELTGIDGEALKVDDDGEDRRGGETGNDGAFKLGATTGVDGGGREGFSDDGFADVGGDEEAINSLEELIEDDVNEGGDDELDSEEEEA
jgi:hypothetical protein